MYNVHEEKTSKEWFHKENRLLILLKNYILHLASLYETYSWTIRIKIKKYFIFGLLLTLLNIIGVYQRKPANFKFDVELYFSKHLPELKYGSENKDTVIVFISYTIYLSEVCTLLWCILYGLNINKWLLFFIHHGISTSSSAQLILFL